MSAHREKAERSWQGEAPDWVAELAAACDRTSQVRTALVIGYSSATISYVLSNRYAGDMKAVEERVRATLMAAEIACPELGALSLAQCLEWRKRGREFRPTSSLRRVMFAACRQCPHNPERGK